jgi:SNW domain-containing protein 1
MLKLKDKDKKEKLLAKLAAEARMERATVQAQSAEDDDEERQRRERDQIRDERRKEIERDLRMQRNKSAAARNLDRDVSEKIALGLAVPTQSTETLYDQRLFNQSQGMSSGFGEEDDYSVYTKPLLQGSSANAIYRPKKNDEESYGTEEDMKKLMDTSKFKPDKGFSGTEQKDKKQEARERPVEFEKEADPFGVDAFLSQAKAKTSGKPNPLSKIGTSGHMSVSSANLETASSGGSKRNRLDFETEKGADSNKKRR